MDIKPFAYALVALSVGAYFIPVENISSKSEEKDIPQVIFEEPIMHTVNDQGVTRLVQASYALKYKTRDEMLDADVILKNLSPDKKFDFEKLKAKSVVKKGDDFTLKKDVSYKRDEVIDFNTQELFYNMKTKIATNTVAYTGRFNNNDVKGNELYLDANQNIIKSKNVHFEIEMKNKK